MDNRGDGARARQAGRRSQQENPRSRGVAGQVRRPDLPGQLELTHADGRHELITNADPAAELARLLTRGSRPTPIDIRTASLDDLFRSLAVTHA